MPKGRQTREVILPAAGHQPDYLWKFGFVCGMKVEFHIKGDFIELVKLLKATGLCTTGGMAKIAMVQGRVMVDRQMERRKSCKIRKGQVVEFDGHIIEVD